MQHVWSGTEDWLIYFCQGKHGGHISSRLAENNGLEAAYKKSAKVKQDSNARDLKEI